jgi:DNA-binding PucR family transcriptional regulator
VWRGLPTSHRNAYCCISRAKNFAAYSPIGRGTFFQADEKARGALVATLRSYANADMNILKAAEMLKVHPNTIYSRLQKILDITGLEARSYHALTELLLIADCGRK